MKAILKRLFFLSVVLVAFAVGANAQSATKPAARDIIKGMATRLEQQCKGVESMVCEKGSGLELLKVAMRGELDKAFLKGVNLIVVIDYSDASAADVTKIRKELDVFSEDFMQKDMPEEVTEGKYVRNFFKASADEEYLTDMIIAAEDEESKCIIYFGGKMASDPKK